MLALFKLVYTAFSVSFWAMAAFVRLVFWILSAVFFQPAYYLTQQYPVISISFILLWYLRDLKPDPSFLATVESMDATNVSLSSLSDATAALPQAIGTSPPKPKPLDTRRRLPNTADHRPAFFMGCLEEDYPNLGRAEDIERHVPSKSEKRRHRPPPIVTDIDDSAMKVKHSRKSKRASNDEANKDSKAIKDKKTRKDKELPSLPFVDSPELESTPRQTSRISPPVTAPWSKANGKRVSAPLSTNKYIPAPFSCRMWAPRRLRATLEEEARVIEITRRAAANEAKKESDAANQAKEEPDAANQAKEESDERTPEPSTPVKESGTSTSSSNSSSTSPATPEMPMTPISAKSTIPFSELFFPYTYPPDLEDHARRLVPSVPFPFSSSIAIQQAVADVQPVVATDKLANEPKIPAAPSLFAQDHLEKSKLMPYQAAIDDVYMHVPLSSSWTDCPRTKYKHIGLNIDTAVRQHLRQQVYQKYIPVIHSAMDMMETEWMAEVFASEVGKIRPVEEHIRW